MSQVFSEGINGFTWVGPFQVFARAVRVSFGLMGRLFLFFEPR